MVNPNFQTSNSQLPTPNSEKGVILIVTLIVIIAVSIYLPAYVTWTIWDQRSLIRQQRAEEAKALAQAGLYRATLDLYMDKGSWLDGWINTWTVAAPNLGNPNNFYALYNENLANGSYAVEIRYLYNTATSSFFDKRMWIRSTGTTPGATARLEQIVNYNVVRNLTRIIDYANLQPAVDDVINSTWNGDTIGITDTILVEDILINGAIAFTIQGCWDPTWTYRSCSNYHTAIQGDWTVTGAADVNLSGITIE